MSNSKNENLDNEMKASGFTLESELNFPQEDALTDQYCYFYHKGLYHANWQHLHTDGRWWGKSEFGPGWYEKVKWHPNLRFRASINRLVRWDKICNVPMKPGQVLTIWGTVFETAWNITSKEAFMKQIENAETLEVVG